MNDMEAVKEDTVKRLRSGPNSSDPVFEEAADEIEALRAELDRAAGFIETHKARIQELEGALVKVAEADFLDFSLAPERSAAAIARRAMEGRS